MSFAERIAEHLAERMAPHLQSARIDAETAEAGRFLAHQLSQIINAPHRVEEGATVRLSRPEVAHLRRLIADMGVAK